MHARDLVELAALVAIHTPDLMDDRGRLSVRVHEDYWMASRLRLDRWTRVLVKLAGAAGELPRPATLAWPRVRPVLEEILLAEPLARIWAAAAGAFDRKHQGGDAEPVARNVLAGQLEARRRTLMLLADGRAIDHSDSQPLNHLRRRIERWTDLLLAHVAPHISIAEFAFDADRARDFADDLDHEAAHADRQLTSQLVLSSLQAALPAPPASERSPSADLNRRIGSAVLASFREGAFEAELVTSLWLERIATTASDTQGLIDELLKIDNVAVLPTGR